MPIYLTNFHFYTISYKNSNFGGNMNPILRILLTFLLISGIINVNATETAVNHEEISKTIENLYPNRKFYPQLTYISTEQMADAVRLNQYNVIDARPKLGYQTLHIKKAYNFSAKDKQFNKKIIDITHTNKKPIVFYCGGLACLKSYKASLKAIKLLRSQNITQDILTYDSGISAFAYANPELVLKHGQKVSIENPLLDMKKLKKHAKSAMAFTQLINNDKNKNYAILDVREAQQRMLRKLFIFKQEKKITVFEPEKLIAYFNKLKQSGQTLMVYGSVEKQIESLYPLIITAGIMRWFYLEGGEVAYSNYMINKHVNTEG